MNPHISAMRLPVDDESGEIVTRDRQSAQPGDAAMALAELPRHVKTQDDKASCCCRDVHE